MMVFTREAAAARIAFGPGRLEATDAEAGTAPHHKIRQVLGGTYNLPHATLHAIVLPPAVA